ncbi:YdcF family protein [Prochlorococcus marinus]|uniref:YdcF family protein n=1 Tax=Prochlorococcus marinus TaxID=1219 RepID=UPI0022B2EFFF|nr:YdcF family protein [Prochlorococcus marinus]
MPLGIFLFLVVLFQLKKSKWIIPTAISIIWLSSIGIVSELLWKWIESPWERLKIEQITKADAIVVLSSARHLPPGKTRIYEWNDPDRFIAGIELFKAGKASNLFFTGGMSPYSPELPPEGSIYIKEAILLGVPSNNLFSTPPVRNTSEEALEIRKLLENNIKNKTPKIILVTSAYHMKRAKVVFERQGLNIFPFPVDFLTKGILSNNRFINPYMWIPNADSLNKTSIALRELIGRIIYRSLI